MALWPCFLVLLFTSLMAGPYRVGVAAGSGADDIEENGDDATAELSQPDQLMLSSQMPSSAMAVATTTTSSNSNNNNYYQQQLLQQQLQQQLHQQQLQVQNQQQQQQQQAVLQQQYQLAPLSTLGLMMNQSVASMMPYRPSFGPVGVRTISDRAQSDWDGRDISRRQNRAVSGVGASQHNSVVQTRQQQAPQQQAPQQQAPQQQAPQQSNTDSNGYAIFIQDCMRTHDKYRAQHGVPALKPSKKVMRYSRKRAKELAETDHFAHPADSPFGENLAWSSKKSSTCAELIAMWYNEIKLYNYRYPSFNTEIGHFTQLVWRDTVRVGCARGFSKRGKGVYLVCNYDPPGNIIGEFRDQVLPPKATSGADQQQVGGVAMQRMLQLAPQSQVVVTTTALSTTATSQSGNNNSNDNLSAQERKRLKKMMRKVKKQQLQLEQQQPQYQQQLQLQQQQQYQQQQLQQQLQQQQQQQQQAQQSTSSTTLSTGAGETGAMAIAMTSGK